MCLGDSGLTGTLQRRIFLRSWPTFYKTTEHGSNRKYKQSMAESTSYAILHLTAVAFILYVVGLALYRVLLSPIAGIPGPKLAALTQWYECYYNVIQPGQFYLHIEELHDIYGMFPAEDHPRHQSPHAVA
jgi:hypothetical protein